MPNGIIYVDVVDDEVVKELTLFRNAEALLFHVSLMDDGKKLKALAHAPHPPHKKSPDTFLQLTI